MIVLGLIALLSNLGMGELGLLLSVPTFFAGIAVGGDLLFPGRFAGVIVIVTIALIDLALIAYTERTWNDPKISGYFSIVPAYLIATAIVYAVLHAAVAFVKERKSLS